MTFEQSLSDALGAERAAKDLAAYLERFAGRHFERIDGGGDRPDTCNEFTAADIAAIGTLSVSLSPEAISELLFGPSAEAAAKALARVPVGSTIYDSEAAALHRGPALDLWQILRSIPDLGRTKTSKLMARKRPHLLPIIDSVVAQALGEPDDYWDSMLQALRSEGVTSKIKALRATVAVPESISDLRMVDIVVWMAYRKDATVY